MSFPTHLRAFVIYDSLYEEYQSPFFLKNENIARIEFDVFVRDMVEKAPENEKARTAHRFHLFCFPLSFDRTDATFLHLVDDNTPPICIKAEPVAQGVSEDV